MLRALQMLVAPFSAWQSIAAGKIGAVWAVFAGFLPLLAAGLFLEFWGLQRYGYLSGDSGKQIIPEAAVLQRYIGVEVAVFLFLLFFGAFIVHALAKSFGARGVYGQSVVLMAYCLGGLAVGRMLDAIPAIPTWACFAIGAALMVRTLYHGVGAALQPDQTKGFGIMIVATVTTLLLSALGHFVAVVTLIGRSSF